MFNSNVTGRLVADAEYAQVGAYNTAKFTIAVNHNKDDVTFVSCTIFGNAWQSIVESYKKGIKVCVSGKVTGVYSYMNKDNEPSSKINLSVNDFDYPHNIAASKPATPETTPIPF